MPARIRPQTAIPLAVIVAFALITTVLLLGNREDATADGTAAEGTTSAAQALREDTHILGEQGSSGVTFVEFLDFECEACGAAYPFVEQLREQYAGRVTFAARYFPIDSHVNARPAAQAVEAAARQGKFEQMYQKMYETQTSWGEGREPRPELFRSFAEELGLDLAAFDSDYASAEVADRIQKDVDEGLALGVQGTPTFFINGELFQPESTEDFTKALDEALAAAQ
ncbi:DsbA family protein [Kineosporia rhizophila]|uniref:DsbA family protein n=1 Tax=Kineosporia rhizophila TaxID=84633 RepID=UPI000B1B77C3|nr:thioredoxin domain-containing protein [Kineosporia rhizophila]MCE0536127.1 DsbA family protein [Kineosporia rhizophila]